MAVSSTRRTVIEFTGDVATSNPVVAATNTNSPGQNEVRNLPAGQNSISLPTTTGPVVTAVTIIPPAGNTILMTLKGVGGDTGISLHKTDPTTLALDTTQASIILYNPAGAVNGLRLIWS